MAEDQVKDDAVTTEEPAGGAEALVKAVDGISTTLEKMEERQVELEKKFDDATQPQYPNGKPFGVRKGEDPLTSRPYSMMRLACALKKRLDNTPDWGAGAKVELDLSNRLKKGYQEGLGYIAQAPCLVPLGSDLIPTEEVEVIKDEKEIKYPGISHALAKECRDLMTGSLAGFDPDMLLQPGMERIRKDLSANTATTGGTLVGLPAQGEVIELLRGKEVMSRAGATEISLPPQGSIRFPRITSGITISAYAEGATITESTPGTAALLLQAKKYTGLVDIPEELLRFATSVAVEAWLRSEFTADLALKVDVDAITGAGGTAIQGVINYSGIRTVTASTTGANGDTLEAQDPNRLYADIADQNAPIERGFFYAMTNTLWGGISTRRADAVSAADAAGSFVFNVATQSVGGGATRMSLNGNNVVTSTQIPTNRAKGSATNLTLLLGGVGAEWLIGRAGVIEFSMTNSDASKFQQGLSTMRGTMFVDGGPRHENSFGYIDDVLNS